MLKSLSPNDIKVKKPPDLQPDLGTSLGIKGKNCAIQEPRGLQPIQSQEIVDQETGEITSLINKGSGLKPVRTAQEYRALRFGMKSVVNCSGL